MTTQHEAKHPQPTFHGKKFIRSVTKLTKPEEHFHTHRIIWQLFNKVIQN